MSRLNAGLYSSNDQTWETPPHIWQAILDFEGVDNFAVDAACSDFNVSAISYLTPAGRMIRGFDGVRQFDELDGLKSFWSLHGLTWLNPPYGKMLQKFMKKAYEESLQGCKIWALIPARTETQYQYDYGLDKAGFTVFLKGRLRFLQNGEVQGQAPFPTMLLYYGDDAEEKAIRWAQNPPLEGTIMRKVK